MSQRDSNSDSSAPRSAFALFLAWRTDALHDIGAGLLVSLALLAGPGAAQTEESSARSQGVVESETTVESVDDPEVLARQTSDAANEQREAEHELSDVERELALRESAVQAARAAVEAQAARVEDMENAIDTAENGIAASGGPAPTEEELESAEVEAKRLSEALAQAEDQLERAREKAESAREQLAADSEKLAGSRAVSETLARVKEQPRGPDMPSSELRLRLRPLDLEGLQREASEWMAILQAQAHLVVNHEIAAQHAEGETVEQIIEALTRLREEQSAIIERMEIVLESLKKRGAETETFERYIKAVSGLPIVAVSDAGTAWTVLRAWLSSSEGGLRWGKNFLFFIGVLVGFRVFASMTTRVTLRAVKKAKGTSDLLHGFVDGFVRNAIMIFGFVVALTMLEFDNTPFLAAMGGLVLVVALALQGTLSNFAAGMLILWYRPYDVGDAIDAGGAKGKVKGMSMISTTLTTFDNQVVTIPNETVWNGVITNLTGNDTRRVDLVFGIGYADDMAKAERILTEVVRDQEQVLDEPEPVIRVHELGDSSVNFVVRPWCRTEDYWDVYWALTRRVKERFDEESITIPFPQRDVHMITETSDLASSEVVPQAPPARAKATESPTPPSTQRS